jgi:hypothetical protein
MVHSIEEKAMHVPTFLALSALLFGCAPDYKVVVDEEGLAPSTADVDDDDDGNEVEEEEDFSMYEGAMIRILAPVSGDFLPWGDLHNFEAVLETPDGEYLPFDGIEWSSDEDDAWMQTGSDVEDDSIDVGTHNITAQAVLPDGSRLAHTIGGVLVQHPDAGTYVGDMILGIDLEFGGTPVGTSCIGGAIVVIDAYGEEALGVSACTLDLLGYLTLEVSHVFEYEIDEDDISGNAFVELTFLGWDLPFESEGSLSDGNMVSSWSGGVGGAELEGTLEVDRITREITEL